MPVKIGKWKASEIIAKESWAIFKQDKEIIWFPIISALVAILALVGMGLIYYFAARGDLHLSLAGLEQVFDEDREMNEFCIYVVFFIYYVISFSIANFFQAGLLAVVQARFSGQDLTFRDGMRAANGKMGRIFIWSLISATVGVVLRAISEKSKLIGKIVIALVGAAWNLLTYFSLPALVIGDLSIKESFKESAALIKKTWGETIIINVGAGLFFMAHIIAAIFFFGFLGFVFPSIFLVFVILAVIYIIGLSMIYSALNSIFKLALYNYARTGVTPAGFSPELVKNAMGPKESVL